MGAAGESDRCERTAACEDRAAVGPGVGLFGGAFGFRRWVGEGEDDGPRIVAGHGLHNGFGEGGRRARNTDQRVRLQGFDDREEIGNRRVIVGKAEFVLHQIGAAADDQSLGVDKPTLAAGHGFGHALGLEGFDDQIANADARFAGSEEQNAHVAQLDAREA